MLDNYKHDEPVQLIYDEKTKRHVHIGVSEIPEFKWIVSQCIHDELDQNNVCKLCGQSFGDSQTTNTTESLEQIIYGLVPCQDCGGYVGDHGGVQGDCNYEAGTEIADNAIRAITKLCEQEVLRGRVDSLDTFATNFNNYAAEHRELFEPEIVGAVWGLLAQQTIPLNTLLGGENDE